MKERGGVEAASWPRRAASYAIAVAIVVLSLALKSVIPELGTLAPFLLLSLAVAGAGWLGGRGPGMVAAVVGAWGVNAWFVDRSTADPVQRVVLVIAELADFLLMALAAATLREALAREAHARAAAERAVAARDSFISTTAHELRNPLTTVLASSELLAREVGSDSAAGKHARAIAHEARRASKLIEDLLDASRLDLAKVAIAATPVDLTAVARTAAASLSARLTGEHRVHVEAPSDAPITGDAGRLEQVLVNLLDNAWKYSPAGAAIELDVRVEGANAVARVSDRGVGLDEEQAARLFEPFYRARPGEFPGVGLGLYVSRTIVRRHGGELWYEPREGGGSTFVVRLPLRRTERELAHGQSIGTQ